MKYSRVSVWIFGSTDEMSSFSLSGVTFNSIRRHSDIQIQHQKMSSHKGKTNEFIEKNLFWKPMTSNVLTEASIIGEKVFKLA